MKVIPGLARQRQEDGSNLQRESSRTVKGTSRNPVLKTKKGLKVTKD